MFVFFSQTFRNIHCQLLYLNQILKLIFHSMTFLIQYFTFVDRCIKPIEMFLYQLFSLTQQVRSFCRTKRENFLNNLLKYKIWRDK